MAISRAALTTAYTNMNFGFPPNAVEQALINSYADQTALAGGLTDQQALLATTQLVGDTTAVAALTYQFFTGSIPSQAGFFYLVNSEGNGDLNPNVNDLNDPYYTSFNQENRYYNFALNLATAPAGANFRTTYTGLSIADTVTVAYETIIGTANAIQAGFNPTAAKADIIARAPTIRAQVVQRLGLADNAANNAAIELAYRAGIVAYILNEAFKASVGNYADALERFLIDIADNGLADGSVDGNGFGGDLLTEYPGVDAAREFLLTSGADVGTNFTGGSGDDTFFGTESTLTSNDILNGGAGNDTLILATSGAPTTRAGFDTTSIEVLQVTADATTTVDVSGMEDLETVINTNSSRNLTLLGMVPGINVAMENTSRGVGGGSVDLTIQYVANQTLGDDTTANISLTNVYDPIDGDSQTDINLTGNLVDGVEIISLAVSGDNMINDLDSVGLRDVNVAGAGNITLEDVNYDQSGTLNAATLTGYLRAFIDNDNGSDLDVVVTGGSANDMIDFTASFDSGDSFAGGAGTADTVILSADTVAPGNLAANSGVTSAVERIWYNEGNLDSDTIWASNHVGMTELNLGGGSYIPDTIYEGMDDGDDATTTMSSGATLTINNLVSTTGTVPLIIADITTLNGGVAGGTSRLFQFDSIDGTSGGTTDTLNVFLDRAGGSDTILEDVNNVVAGPDVFDILNLKANSTGADTTVRLRSFADLNTLNIDWDPTDATPANTILTIGGGFGDTTGLTAINAAASTGGVNLNDVVVSTSGVTITGGSGNDQIGNGFGSRLTDSMDGNDTVNAGAGNDVAWGGLGNDTLNGQDGNDTLRGQQGNDIINGGIGNDLIVGGFGADNLTGGTGADTFRYEDIQDSQAALIDTITDFEVGVDFINLLPALQAANPLVFDASDVTFVGNVDSQLQGETALIGGGNVGAFYVRSNNTLYVDVDGNGDIDIDDMVIVVNTVGEADLTAASIAATFAPVTFTASVVGFNTNNPTQSVEGNTTTAANDVINTTFARLAGATVNGQGGVDVLNITDQINVITDLETYATIDNIDRLALRAGSTDLVTAPDINGLVITLGAAGIVATFDDVTAVTYGQTVQGSQADDVITLNNEADQAFGRNGDDQINVVNAGVTAAVVDGGDGDDTIFVSGATVYTGTLDGGDDDDFDTLVLGDGADISGATILDFDEINFDDDATMTTAQHEALKALFQTNGNLGNTITITDGGVMTTSPVIENYLFTGVFSNDVTLGDNDTDVDLGDGNGDILRTGGFTTFGGQTFGGGAGTGDTFQITGASVDLTAGTDVVFSGFEVLGIDNNLNVTISNGQHAQFGSASATGTNTATLSNTFTGTTFGTIETYNLTGGNDNFTVGGNNQTINMGNGANTVASSGTNVTANGGTGVDTFNVTNAQGGSYNGAGGANVFNISNSGSTTAVSYSATAGGQVANISNSTVSGSISGTYNLSGTIAGTVNSGTAQYNLADGTVFSASSNFLAGVDTAVLATGGSFTLTNGFYNAITSGATALTAAGNETVTISNTANISAQQDAGNEIENYVLASTGNDTFSIALNAASIDWDLNISAGGTDTINLNNVAHLANAPTDGLDVVGFTAGGGGDIINFDSNGQAIGLTFQTIASNSNTTLTGGAGALVEITGATVNAAGAQDVADGGTVEGVIAAAIGATNAGSFAVNDFIGVILYDANGTGYLYSVQIDVVADLGTGTHNVELVGTFTNVGLNSFDGSNFI